MVIHYSPESLEKIISSDDFLSNYGHTYVLGSDSDTPGSTDADNTIGWKDMEAWLVEGTHTFTFTTTDGYETSASSSTTFEIMNAALGWHLSSNSVG